MNTPSQSQIVSDTEVDSAVNNAVRDLSTLNLDVPLSLLPEIIETVLKQVEALESQLETRDPDNAHPRQGNLINALLEARKAIPKIATLEESLATYQRMGEIE